MSGVTELVLNKLADGDESNEVLKTTIVVNESIRQSCCFPCLM